MEYKPGDTVPQSGIYRVDHESHRVMHEAKLQAKTRFPRCRHCKDDVRFYLLESSDEAKIQSIAPQALLEEYTEPEAPMAPAV